MYTNALRSRFYHCVLIKYVDNTINVGLITNRDDTNYKTQIGEASQWCRSHSLLLNVIKTKEMIFDFTHCDITFELLIIKTDQVEICQSFLYPGFTIDYKQANQVRALCNSCFQM